MVDGERRPSVEVPVLDLSNVNNLSKRLEVLEDRTTEVRASIHGLCEGGSFPDQLPRGSFVLTHTSTHNAPLNVTQVTMSTSAEERQASIQRLKAAGLLDDDGKFISEPQVCIHRCSMCPSPDFTCCGRC